MAKFKLPKVGDVVTVTTQYPSNRADDETQDTTYENMPVIDPKSWTPPNSFCIPAEGEPFITFRTISMDNVISLTVEGKVGDVETNTSTEYKKVPGGQGKTYTVTLVNGVATTCECLGFQYRKQCRHLRIAMGEKPVNPRRETIKKAKRKAAAAKRKPRSNAPTKASVVRDLIRQNKGKHNQAQVTDEVIKKLGMTRSLATTYVKNNWEKV